MAALLFFHENKCLAVCCLFLFYNSAVFYFKDPLVFSFCYCCNETVLFSLFFVLAVAFADPEDGQYEPCKWLSTDFPS
jgi:hypothetical protein